MPAVCGRAQSMRSLRVAGCACACGAGYQRCRRGRAVPHCGRVHEGYPDGGAVGYRGARYAQTDRCSPHTHPTHTYSVAHASILRSGETTWRQERLSVVQKHPLVTRWGHFVGFCFARAFVCVHVDRPRHSRRARHFLPGPVYAHPTHQLCGGRWGCCFLSPAPTQLYVLACLSVHASQWRRRGRRLFGLSEPHAFVRRL